MAPPIVRSEFLPDTGPNGRADRFSSIADVVLGHAATGVELRGPRAVAATAGGALLFVADMASHCVWRCRSGERPVVVAGKPGVQGGGPIIWPGDGCVGTDAALEYPHDVALAEHTETLYICELYCVKALSFAAEPPTLSTVYQSEYGLGGIALSLDGRSLVIAQHSRHLLQEIPLLPECGATEARTLAGTGEPGRLVSDAYAREAYLNNPTKVAVMPSGDVVFVDAGNRTVRLLQQATGILRTLSGAIDAPDGLAVGPEGTIFISEGRSFQVLQFRPSEPGSEWNWGTCAGTGFGDDAQVMQNEKQVATELTSEAFAWQGLPSSVACPSQGSRPALETSLARPQGLCWVPGCGLLICDARGGAVYLARALSPWMWYRGVVLPRALMEQGRAHLLDAAAEDLDASLHQAVSILMALPDEEFREALSWWTE